MKIKKLGHCCLLIETNSKRILLDPGYFTVEEHSKLTHIDIIIITHEHADHFHVESLKELVKRMSEVKVITNDAVAVILEKEGVKHTMMKHGDDIIALGIHIEAFGKLHAMLHSSIPQVSNIGFFVADRFFFPGDALTDPKKPVDILALPVAGPWMKISEALDYALKVKPRISFPVHDAILKSNFMNPLVEKVLNANGIDYVKLDAGQEFDFIRS